MDCLSCKTILFCPTRFRFRVANTHFIRAGVLQYNIACLYLYLRVYCVGRFVKNKATNLRIGITNPVADNTE